MMKAEYNEAVAWMVQRKLVTSFAHGSDVQSCPLCLGYALLDELPCSRCYGLGKVSVDGTLIIPSYLSFKAGIQSGIVGRCNVVGVIPAEGGSSSSPWWMGAFALLLENVEVITKPIPLPGSLGFFGVDDALQFKRCS